MLPPTESGQQVILADRRQITAQTTALNRLRCVFYLAKKYAEDPSAQTRGIVCIIIVIMPRLLEFDRDYSNRAWKLTAEVFPVKVQSRIVCQIPKMGKFYMVQQIIAAYVKNMTDAGLNFSDLLDIHIEQEEEKLLKELLDAGFRREGLPKCVGGTWAYVQAMVWVQTQAREERDLKLRRERENRKCNQQGKKRARKLTDTTIPLEGVAMVAPVAVTSNTSDAAHTSTKKRTALNKEECKAANAIYSRRKRERRNIELQALHREHDKSVKDHALLKAEHTRLQELLTRAQAIISSTDFTRAENATDVGTSSDPVEGNPQAHQGGPTALHSPSTAKSSDERAPTNWNPAAPQDETDATSLAGNSLMQASIAATLETSDDVSIRSRRSIGSSILEGCELDDQSVDSGHWGLMNGGILGTQNQEQQQLDRRQGVLNETIDTNNTVYQMLAIQRLQEQEEMHLMRNDNIFENQQQPQNPIAFARQRQTEETVGPPTANPYAQSRTSDTDIDLFSSVLEPRPINEAAIRATRTYHDTA